MVPLLQRMSGASRSALAVVLVAAQALLLCGDTPARAADPAAELRKEMTKLALAVKEVLASENQTAVSLGRFEGTEALPTSGGVGMTQMLTEELTKAGLTVTPKADAVVKAKFSMTKALQPGDDAALRIQTELVDGQDRALAAFNLAAKGKFIAEVKNDAVVTAALGVTGSIPPDANPADRADRIRSNLADPPGHVIGGTKFCADAASPYQVEVVVGGQPLPVSIENKLGQCDIPLGKTFVINLHNNSDYDASVRVAIDGVNVFHFSELRQAEGPNKGQPMYDSYIIPAKRFIQLQGWHKTNKSVDSFLVGGLAQGAAVAAAQQAAQGKVGMITCQYSAAWDINGAPPPDEPSPKKGTPRAVGFGPPIPQVVAEVKRNIGVLRATVALRYDK